MTQTKFPFEGKVWAVDPETDTCLIRAPKNCNNGEDLYLHTKKNGEKIYYFYEWEKGKKEKYIRPITTEKALEIIEEHEKLCNDTI